MHCTSLFLINYRQFKKNRIKIDLYGKNAPDRYLIIFLIAMHTRGAVEFNNRRLFMFLPAKGQTHTPVIRASTESIWKPILKIPYALISDRGRSKRSKSFDLKLILKILYSDGGKIVVFCIGFPRAVNLENYRLKNLFFFPVKMWCHLFRPEVPFRERPDGRTIYFARTPTGRAIG